MKVTYFASSTILIEADGKKILMDPWLEDGEYYGSWAHYPPVNVDYSIFNDVDYIYITHIHPDHLSKKTMAKLRPSIPVLIHSYDGKFLKRNIEAMGFVAEELENGATKQLTPDFSITIYAADDCNPEACGNLFRCVPTTNRTGSTQIDSLCVVEHGEDVLVNTNDCPFSISQHILPKIRDRFGPVKMLLTGFSGAGPYPQCFDNLDMPGKMKAAGAKRLQFLRQGLFYIAALDPEYVLPFAGQYVLSGVNASLNDLRGVPELADARDYFEEHLKSARSKIVLLDRDGSIDLRIGKIDKPYKPEVAAAFDGYAADVLRHRQYDFDADADPTEEELVELARTAAERVEHKRKELGVTSDTRVYVRLTKQKLAKVSLTGKPLEIVDDIDDEPTPFVEMKVQEKLLKRILSGPRIAHWNNATIGSHVTFNRKPDIYEADIYEVMNYFHA
jgi:UDP-MurNAc hydroxylase